jgi:hypothetical protein
VTRQVVVPIVMGAFAVLAFRTVAFSTFLLTPRILLCVEATRHSTHMCLRSQLCGTVEASYI